MAAHPEMRKRLNDLAGTTDLDEAGAANAWAETEGLETVGALNAGNGTHGVEFEQALLTAEEA